MLKLNCQRKQKDRLPSLSEGQTNKKTKKPKIQNLKNQSQKQKKKSIKTSKWTLVKRGKQGK